MAYDENAGTNKLANVLSDRMQYEGESSLVLDFGEIQSNGSLLTNTFPVAIPKGSYSVCKHVTEYTATADISGGSVSGSTSTENGHTHSISGTVASGGDPEHTHGFSGSAGSAGGHSHSFGSLTDSGASLTVHNALKAGDRVLVAWVNSEAVVIDRITSS